MASLASSGMGGVGKGPMPIRDPSQLQQQQQQQQQAQAQQQQQPSAAQSGLRYPTSGKTIYHRPLNRTRTAELSQSAFAYLFSEMVGYAQRRVTGIQDLEKR